MKQRDIQHKIDFLIDNFEKLRRLKKYSLDELLSHFERVDSVLHRLQTTIEALLDIGRYIISSLGLRIPTTSAEVIDILKDESLIPEKEVRGYIEMIGFRNRVVHEYNTVDVSELYEILHKESGDLKKLYTRLSM